jgi:hypothetical protein
MTVRVNNRELRTPRFYSLVSAHRNQPGMSGTSVYLANFINIMTSFRHAARLWQYSMENRSFRIKYEKTMAGRRSRAEPNFSG